MGLIIQDQTQKELLECQYFILMFNLSQNKSIYYFLTFDIKYKKSLLGMIGYLFVAIFN